MSRPAKEFNKEELSKRASALATAKPTQWDTEKGLKSPADVPAASLKICEDKELRDELVAAQGAVVLQRPKGQRKRSFIIQLYPNFDAPKAVVVRRGPRGGSGTTTTTTTGRRAVAVVPKLSIEALEAFVTDYKKAVADKTAEQVKMLDEAINQARKMVATAKGDDAAGLELLSKAISEKKNATSLVSDKILEDIRKTGIPALEPILKAMLGKV